MKIIWLDSLLRIEGNHHPGFVIGKPFECIFGNEEGKGHIDVFFLFDKIAIVTMSKFCKIYSWNFLDKYGSTRSICFEILVEFGSREREWSN